MHRLRLGGPASTTHISVIDAAGNAVGITFSHGESNACVLEGMGIMMNNFLGEEDILPDGLGSAPPGKIVHHDVPDDLPRP